MVLGNALKAIGRGVAGNAIMCTGHALLCKECWENARLPGPGIAVVTMTPLPHKWLPPLRTGVEANSETRDGDFDR